ncbi:MAG: hypothetical protein IPK26_27760 [Planctomycetes bacterium]|nr:hypothetical protein [Planctomycetota bacterium]
MSASDRRRRFDRKSDSKPVPDTGKQPPAGDAGDLPELEPIDDALDSLEPIVEDKSGIVVTVTAATDKAFHTAVQIQVPEMDKKAIADALPAPLERALASAANSLRWRRIVVTFGGDAMIGSSARDAVAQVLRAHKAARVIVRRGYGDENVHEATPPKANVTTRQEGNALHVEVQSFELESADLPGAMAADLEKIVATVRGKAVTLQFTGAAPDAAFAQHLHHSLADAGAVRGTLSGRLLFDRDLEARVQISGNAQEARLAVSPADDPAVTAAALELVLPGARSQITGRRVRVAFTGRSPKPQELEHLQTLVAAARPTRIELDHGSADADILWPPLLQLQERDGQVQIAVAPNGRTAAALPAAFAREAKALAKVLAGKGVTIHFPADLTLDAALERACVHDAIGGQGSKSVHCTFGGDHKEPFLPPPVTITTGKDGLRAIAIDVDSGKPPEVIRAIERRLRNHGELKGQRVRIGFTGSAAPSRTLLRSAVDEVLRGGATRVELEDRGKVDVLVPALLTIQKDGDSARISGDAGGRDEAQVQTAMARELEAGGVTAGGKCIVMPGPLAETMISVLVGRGAARITLADKVPVLVHPALFAPAERKGDTVTFKAAPADAAAAPAQAMREVPAMLAKAGDLKTTAIALVWPGAKDARTAPVAAVLRMLVDARPAKVLFDNGSGKAVQVFPEVVAAPAPATTPTPAAAASAPAAPPAAVAPTVARDPIVVLGRKHGAKPPLLMFGLDATADAAKVNGKLDGLAGQADGCSVLLVLQKNGRDVAAADGDPVLVAVRARLDAKAAAVMVFRGPGRGFEVVASTTEAIAIGSKFADPRAPRA